MGRTKKSAAPVANQRIQKLQDMIDSDSDSYGSEGGLKEKVVVVKKRGGKKRNKNGELVSCMTGDTGFTLAENEQRIEDIEAQLGEINQQIEQKASLENEKETKDNQDEVQRQAANQDNLGPQSVPSSEVEEEEKTQINQDFEEAVQPEAQYQPQHVQPQQNEQAFKKTTKSGFKPMKQRKYSPPMITEYDPNEGSAKARAKKRADAIQKKQDIYDIDKSHYPDHPTPWKGKSSDFFILHEPRRGDTKVLNNSQKEFILVYYPDKVVDDVSLMEFLYRQAKDNEDKSRWETDQNEREAQIIRGRTKKKARKRPVKQQPPEYIKELAHQNKSTREMTTIGYKPMSFESLLEGDQQHTYKGPDYHSVTAMRTQLTSLQNHAEDKYIKAYNLEKVNIQHHEPMPQLGYCTHCQSHGLSYAPVRQEITLSDDVDIARQQILVQICDAKKRQARMEAEEARRLRDEARRLAEQAHILELEAQRPLLEAQKLELEAQQLEAQISRIPHHLMQGQMARAGSQNMSFEQVSMQHRHAVDLRKQQLMTEAVQTQSEIKRLQQEAMRLQGQMSNPEPRQAPQAADLTGLYAALRKTTEVPKARPLAQPKPVMAPRTVAAQPPPQPKVVVAQPNIVKVNPERPAVQKEQPAQTQPRKQSPKIMQRQIKFEDPEQHNYSYGEESDEQVTDDPALAAANKEYKLAQKMFQEAQKLKEKAKKKTEDRIKRQQDDIEKAQEQTQKYFEEEKKKHKEENKLKKPQDLRQSQQIDTFQNEQTKLLHDFNTSINKLKKESQAVHHRFVKRYDIFEFIHPILTGKIFRDFDESQGYINFSQFYLDQNFKGGHQEYFYKWRHLFLFETYSFLINSRFSKFTGNEIQMKNLIKQSQEKTMSWKGYLQYHSTEGKLSTVKLFKEPPNVHQYSHKGKNYSKIYEEADRPEGSHFDLSHCREDDLIIISKYRINLEGQEDIKMVSGGIKFLKEVMSKQGVTFGYVARANTKDNNYVELWVDSKQANQFQTTSTAEGSNVFTRYLYFFESVLTNLREFRALKCLEFTRLAPLVCYPSLTLDYKQKMTDNYITTIDNSFGTLEPGPELNPKCFDLEHEKMQDQMNKYMIETHAKYNKSQCKVLEQVIEMPQDDVLLIQGPPGTGKTHTIIGIISMIMSTKLAHSRQKIMVCAPSNAAIDQIIQRIIERGLIGLRNMKEKDREENKKNDISDDSDDFELPDLSQSLVRISGSEYQADSNIKKYTLDQRIIKKLCIEKFGDLKRCIKDLKEMINSMNNYEDWDDNSSFPFVSKAKFTAFTKILKGSHLKMVSNWGVNTLNRQQQLQAMELQLKMHNSELNEFKQGTNIHQGNLEWKEAEKAIIYDANIVCCTLSMAGSNKLDTFRDKFEYLIIDEACQSTEPSTMIPMQHAPKRVILVGDQKQLPATTFSGNSEQTGYCKSLFERLLDAGFDKTMLTIQFRMHPKIRAFPSEQFYGGAITDHPSIGIRNAPQQIINLAQVFPQRIIFFDIQDSEEVYDNKSKCNYEEADFTKILVDFIARKSSLQGTLKYIQGKIGVISPYKAQVKQLFSRLDKLCSDQQCLIHDTIDVNTVDAFQGSEKDIIIFNCVRSNFESFMEKSLGFLLDERRLNVAITRPKYFLMIIGNSKTLKKSGVWENMINYCSRQGSYIQVAGRHQYESISEFKKHILPQFIES